MTTQHPGRTNDLPKVKDLPPPRRTGSAIGPLFRTMFAWPYRLILAGLYRAGVRPWQLTFLSVVANVVIGGLLVTRNYFAAGASLIVAGLLDIFDGGVARLRGEDGPAGAFLDSVADRVCDIVLFGCIFWAEAAQAHRLAAALALGALASSLMVSYVRAEAEAKNLTLTEGLMQRLERYVALMIGLMVPNALLPVLALLTVLGGLTALQRAFLAYRRLPASDPDRERVTRPAPPA